MTDKSAIQTTEEPPGSCCRKLLSEGLDLCVRARKMDAMDRTTTTLSISADAGAWEASGRFAKHAKQHNCDNPDRPMMTRSGTMYLWIIDQYEKDLAAWERRSREHLLQGC